MVAHFYLLYFLELLATKSFDYESKRTIKYWEDESVDYLVYLKPNDFYEEDYLKENMIYVASLINQIKATFNYSFQIEENTDVDFSYKVIADLVIASENGNTKYFEKPYVLVDSKEAKITDGKSIEISEEVNIDYDYYNRLANTFRTSYAVDANSYLKVYLQVDKVNGEKANFVLNDSVNVPLTIPLAERSIEISFDSQNSQIINNVPTNAELVFNLKVFIPEIVLFIASSVLLVYLINLIYNSIKRKSAYDKYIDKLLREYDRLIVETKTEPDFTEGNVIEIDKIEELLDVRDSLKLPIMYYNAIKHHICHLYVKHEDDFYLLTLKAENFKDNERDS